MHRIKLYSNIMVAIVFIVSLNTCINTDAYRNQYAREVQENSAYFSQLILKQSIGTQTRTKESDKAIDKAIKAVKDTVLPQTTRDCSGRHYIGVWDRESYIEVYCHQNIGVEYVSIVSQSDNYFVINLQLQGTTCDTDKIIGWYYLQVTMNYKYNITGIRSNDEGSIYFPIYGNGIRVSDEYSCHELEQFFITQKRFYNDRYIQSKRI